MVSILAAAWCHPGIAIDGLVILLVPHSTIIITILIVQILTSTNTVLPILPPGYLWPCWEFHVGPLQCGGRYSSGIKVLMQLLNTIITFTTTPITHILPLLISVLIWIPGLYTTTTDSQAHVFKSANKLALVIAKCASAPLVLCLRLYYLLLQLLMDYYYES
jgi:hypothetical protein